jgi:hypothetical protein
LIEILSTMTTNEYQHQINKIELTTSTRTVSFGRGYYSEGESQFPLVYKRNHHTVKRKNYVYRVHLYGQTNEDCKGFYVAFNFWQNIRFLGIQRKLWIHDKDFFMWFINIVVAGLAIIASIKAAN